MGVCETEMNILLTVSSLQLCLQIPLELVFTLDWGKKVKCESRYFQPQSPSFLPHRFPISHASLKSSPHPLSLSLFT